MAYEKKHLEILKTAAAVFAKQGYHNTPVRDLSRATGRSLSGLYYYFSSKEELLYQVQHHCYSTLLVTVRTALANATTPRDRLLSFISHHITYFRHNMNEMKVLAHEDVTLTGDLAKKILEVKRNYSQVLIDILTEYDDGIPVGPAPDTPGRPAPDVAAFILFGAMNWLYTWPRRLRQLPADELAGAVAQIFLSGYPGCPGTSMTGIEESILCTPQQFWKGNQPPLRQSGTE